MSDRRTLVLGTVAGAVVSLSSLLILLKAVLHTQEHSAKTVPAEIQIEALRTSLLYTVLAFVVCGVGLALFIRCVAALVIQMRTASRPTGDDG